MTLRILTWASIGIGLGASGSLPTAQAQVGTSNLPASASARPSPFGAGALGGNPAYNPFLNPMVMPYTANPDVMWYLYATGQYYGSSIPGTQGGRLNGNPPGASASTPVGPNNSVNFGRGQGVPKAQNSRRPGARPVAEMPLSSSTPGSSAAGYFYRGPGARNGAGRYFNRPLNQFQNNGR